MATKAVTHYAISIRLACRIFKVSESCYRYQPVLVDENQEIADWLLRITASQRNWGFGLCFLYLRVSIHRNSIDTGKMRRSSLDPTFLLA